MSLQQQVVTEWLLDYKRLDKGSHGDVHSYCIRIESDSTTTSALFKVLDDPKCHDDFLECVCDQLFNYYRSKETRLRTFAISFLPLLIGIHLDQVRKGAAEQKKYQCIEVMLLGIYNLEVVDDEGNPVERKLRLPLLSKPSVYHEPSQHSVQTQQSTLTENALLKLESGTPDLMISSFGPYVELDQIISSTRMTIVTVLMKVYNQHLSSVSKDSLISVCRTCVKIFPQPQTSIRITPGRPNQNSVISSTPPQQLSTKNTLLKYSELISKGVPRVQPSPEFLVELSYAVYFCLFNDVLIDGRRALDRIHSFGLYYLFPDVLLMTGAIRNSLRLSSFSCSVESEESPLELGIAAALSPTSSVTSQSVVAPSGISKTAITNASFKTKKLPDDIPIITSANLTSIDEGEETSPDPKHPVKDTKGKGQNPPGKIILKTLQKNRERIRDSIHSLKNKQNKTENGDVVKIRSESESAVMNQDGDVGSVSSGISDSKSFGSDHEMIPLNVMSRNTATVNSDSGHHEGNMTDGDASSPLINHSDQDNSNPHSRSGSQQTMFKVEVNPPLNG